MKFHTEYLTLHTKTKRAYIHLTPQVETALKKSGIKDGMILVSAMHITAGVYVNDNESGLIEDIDQWLETLAPFRQNYQHHQTGEDKRRCAPEIADHSPRSHRPSHQRETRLRPMAADFLCRIRRPARQKSHH
jgi:thiamine phosphate synthase YjbQ (UPF0047 family)